MQTRLELEAELPEPQSSTRTGGALSNGTANRVMIRDREVHDWYRFVLSFPPHLVRSYVANFGLTRDSVLLDPFCGTGTSLVECKKLGIPSIGLEAHPMTAFAAGVKVDWTPDPTRLISHAEKIAVLTSAKLSRQGVPDTPLSAGTRKPRVSLRTLEPEKDALLLTGSISPRPLHKTLVLLETLEKHKDDQADAHERLALARALVSTIANVRFGPEVGVTPPKTDAAVVASWLANVRTMARDLARVHDLRGTEASVRLTDSRNGSRVLRRGSVSAVITSPPYPNEKDYTRTTRLESVLLGFVTDKEQLRQIKKGLVRSNTRGIYIDDTDDQSIEDNAEIQRIAAAIERRRIELGKTSGFERMYPRAAKLYFGGMHRHLADLRDALAPGARLAYVVGDQASYLRVMIRTGSILADIAKSLGYVVERIDLFRTRLATVTGEQLREEAVILRWPS